MPRPPSELFHGTRRAFAPGAAIPPEAGFVACSPALDAAIWAAALAEGDDPPRVYRVAPTGEVEDATHDPAFTLPPHPAMTWRSRAPLTVVAEVTEWTAYHGTRAALRPGDLVAPGHAANHGPTTRTANHVYFARTLDAAIWGAELAAGDGPGRIYVVEPTGPVEADPNLTNARFRGNPTGSFRSRSPLRVVREVTGWTGHPPGVVRAMRDGLLRLAERGVEPEDS